MAERKAVNKYYPPEWTPQQGSINKFKGTHALRERARKLHLGILIIRFEMPFNIWCEGCGNHIGMGVRYNAEKTKVGMYYTTPVYKFRMKCHLCTNHFEIQTDPQNLDYTILNGARRQERRWDPSENDQIAAEEKEVSKKLALDPMYRLEHAAEDKEKQKALMPSLARLEEYKERWKNDYDMNKLLRQTFREKKKSWKASEEKDKALLRKSSLNMRLLPESADDVKLAGLLKLTPLETFEERQKRKREQIISRPLFTTTLAATKVGKIQSSRSDAETSTFLISKPDADEHDSANLGIVQKAQKTLSSPLSVMQAELEDSTETHAESNKRSSLVALEYDSATSDDNTE